MSLWWILLVVCAAGAIGGVVNALMTDNGFVLPQSESVDTYKIIRPGYLGNILIGAVGAGISWGLYGPFTAAYILGGASAPGTPTQVPGLTLSALAGAVLVGVGGARWLTNEVDKKLLTAAASKAASAKPDGDKAKRMLMASPAQALDIAKSLPS